MTRVYMEIIDFLARTRRNLRIKPPGSARDMHVYILDAKFERNFMKFNRLSSNLRGEHPIEPAVPP